MRFTTHIAAAVLATGVVVSADCGKNAKLVGGNWYCSAVDSLVYNNFGTAGTYNKITKMASDGSCESVPKSFTGPLSPLNEQVSLHFRGPLQLKQFAAYTMSAQKRDISEAKSRRSHGHSQFHARHAEAKASPAEKEHEKREDWVVATIDGQVVSWINNYFGPGAAAPTPSAPPPPPPIAAVAAVVKGAPLAAAYGAGVAKASPTTTSTAAKKTSSPGTSSGSSAYTRIGYYDSSSQTLDGLVFLGNYGGDKSGVFDNVFGNSLSYLDASGVKGAESAEVLSELTIPSNKEFAIFTDKECGDSDCGYVRPGTVAYHGFEGADKIFLFEYSMPSDGTTGFNADMPAIWMLNAEIPRTLQYGAAKCSCWATGCGEFDIVEVLSSGSNYCKSTVHTNTPGGDSNYIERPTSGTMKLAVIFASDSSQARIQVLPSDTDFSTGLTSAQVSAWTKTSTATKSSIFNIVS